MKTPNIDLETFLDSVLETINKQHEETFKVFAWDIKQTNEVIDFPVPEGMEKVIQPRSKKCICKTLYLYASDVRNNERKEIWAKKLVLQTPADVLRYPYKKHLLKLLYTELLHFSLINIANLKDYSEDISKVQSAEDKINI